jgi:histone H3/H4
MAISKRAGKKGGRGSCKGLSDKFACDKYKNDFNYVCAWDEKKSKCYNTKILSNPFRPITKNAITKFIFDVFASSQYKDRIKKIELSSLIYEEIRAIIRFQVDYIIHSIDQICLEKNVDEQTILNILRYVPGLKITANHFNAAAFRHIIDNSINEINTTLVLNDYVYTLIQFEIEHVLKMVFNDAFILLLGAKRNTLFPRDITAATYTFQCEKINVVNPRRKILPEFVDKTFEKEYAQIISKRNLNTVLTDGITAQLNVFNSLLISYVLNMAVIQSGNTRSISEADMHTAIAYTLKSNLQSTYDGELLTYFLRNLSNSANIFNIKTTSLKLTKDATQILNTFIEYINAELLSNENLTHFDAFLDSDYDFKALAKTIGFLPVD